MILRTDSKLDCFALFGDQTAAHFRERFQLGLTTQAVDAYLERLIVTSTGSNYTKLYDTFQYYRLVFFPFSVLHPRSLTWSKVVTDRWIQSRCLISIKGQRQKREKKRGKANRRLQGNDRLSWMALRVFLENDSMHAKFGIAFTIFLPCLLPTNDDSSHRTGDPWSVVIYALLRNK